MPNKIIDEFTDRDDLSANQKWELRHPERLRIIQKRYREKRGKAVHASEMRVWRDKNPDSYLASVKKYRRKQEIKKVEQTRREIAIEIFKERPLSKSRRQEVLRFFERGKSLADIVIYTNIPYSVVTKIIESAQKPIGA